MTTTRKMSGPWKSRRHLEQLVESKDAVICEQRQGIIKMHDTLSELAQERDFFDDANQKLGRENNELIARLVQANARNTDLESAFKAEFADSEQAKKERDAIAVSFRHFQTLAHEWQDELVDVCHERDALRLDAVVAQNGSALEIYHLKQRMSGLEQQNTDLTAALERAKNSVKFTVDPEVVNIYRSKKRMDELEKANTILSQQVETFQNMLGKISQVVSAAGMADDEYHTVFGVMAMHQEILGLSEALARCDPWLDDPTLLNFGRCVLCGAELKSGEHYLNCAWKAAQDKRRLPTSRRLAQLEMQLEYTVGLYNNARQWARLWKRSAKEHREIFNALADVRVGDVIDRIKTVRGRSDKIEVVEE